MGGIVNGLDIQTKDTAIGKLARRSMATRVAMIICPGKGINAIKIPTLTAVETLYRFRCQKLGLWIKSPK